MRSQVIALESSLLDHLLPIPTPCLLILLLILLLIIIIILVITEISDH